MTPSIVNSSSFTQMASSHGAAGLLRGARAAGLAGLCAIAAQVCATAATDAASPVVGEATLVIGQARITGADGGVRNAERGGALRVGDVIETQPGGHVHLRFVDGARVSVRPASRLLVEQYAQASAGQGAIKFRLDEGVVRSITGAWGEAARERFRLNTPVAAIGVKGTDFVVRSSGETTAASVFTGAIVVAPLAGACAATVGPCADGSEKLLSADMKGQMLELRRDQPTPRLVPAVDLLALARANAADLRAERAERPMSADPARSDVPAADKPVVSERLASETLALASALARGTPEQALYWVRNPWAAALTGDDFARRFNDALVQGTRTVATDGAFSLRRPEATAFAPQDASANFRLTGGAAGVFRTRPYDVSGNEVEAVQIDKGTLSVDFARSTFATEITATGPRMGTAQVQASGGIDASGAMRSSAGNASMVGGFNGDGHKAGLAFRRDVSGGVLQGVTLWGR